MNSKLQMIFILRIKFGQAQVFEDVGYLDLDGVALHIFLDY